LNFVYYYYSPQVPFPTGASLYMYLSLYPKPRDSRSQAYWYHEFTTLTFLGKVTWRYRSRDQLIRRMSFPVDDTSVTRLYLHFKLFASKYIWVTILILQGHIMSPVTRPFDTPGAISYRWSTVTKSVSPAIFEINGPKDIGVTTLTLDP